MHTTNDLLDLLKSRLSLPSDYALSGYLGVTRSMISGYRRRGISLGDETAIWAADILGMDRGYILACMAAERTKRPDVRKAWEAVAKKASAAVLAVFIGFFALLCASPATVKADQGMYIMLNDRPRYRGRRWRALFAFLSGRG